MSFVHRDPFIPATVIRSQRRRTWRTRLGVAAAAGAGLAISLFVFPNTSPWAERPNGAVVQESPEARYRRLIKEHFHAQISRIRIEDKIGGICTTDCGEPGDPFNYPGKTRAVEGRDAQNRLRLFAFTEHDEPIWEAVDVGHRRFFIQRNEKGKPIALKVATAAMGGGGWVGELYTGEQEIARWVRAFELDMK